MMMMMMIAIESLLPIFPDAATVLHYPICTGCRIYAYYSFYKLQSFDGLAMDIIGFHMITKVPG